jgi:hypothetical protein
MPQSPERHLEAGARHEQAAASHERAARYWDQQGDADRAALQRELAPTSVTELS